MLKNDFNCDCNIIHKEIVEETRKKLPIDKKFNQAAHFFKILGDTTRNKILFALDQNEMCVCDIANLLNMSKSSISHQLSNLRKNKIVKCRKSGKTVYYSLDDEHVSQVFELGFAHIDHQERMEDHEKNL